MSLINSSTLNLNIEDIRSGCNKFPGSVCWGTNSLVLYGSHSSVAVYRPSLAKLISLLSGHTDSVTCVRWIHNLQNGFNNRYFTPELEFISGSADSTMILWRITNNQSNPFEIVQVLRGHSGAIQSLEIVSMPNGANFLVSTSSDHSLMIWFRASPTQPFQIFQSISFAPSFPMSIALFSYSSLDLGVLLAVGCEGDLETGTAPDRLMTDYVYLASASQDNTALSATLGLNPHSPEGETVDESASFVGIHEATLTGHTSKVTAIVWAPPRRTEKAGHPTLVQPSLLVTSSMDSLVMVWRPEGEGALWMNEVCLGQITENTLGFTGVVLGETGKAILGHRYNGALELWGKEGLFDGERGEEGRDAMGWQSYPTVTGASAPITSLSSISAFPAVLSSSLLSSTVSVYAPRHFNSPVPHISFFEIARPLVHGHKVVGVCVADEGDMEEKEEEEPQVGTGPPVKKGRKLKRSRLPLSIAVASEEKPLRVLEATQDFFKMYHSATASPFHHNTCPHSHPLPAPSPSLTNPPLSICPTLMSLSSAARAEASTQRLSNIPIFDGGRDDQDDEGGLDAKTKAALDVIGFADDEDGAKEKGKKKAKTDAPVEKKVMRKGLKASEKKKMRAEERERDEVDDHSASDNDVHDEDEHDVVVQLVNAQPLSLPLMHQQQLKAEEEAAKLNEEDCTVPTHPPSIIPVEPMLRSHTLWPEQNQLFGHPTEANCITSTRRYTPLVEWRKTEQKRAEEERKKADNNDTNQVFPTPHLIVSGAISTCSKGGVVSIWAALTSKRGTSSAKKWYRVFCGRVHDETVCSVCVSDWMFEKKPKAVTDQNEEANSTDTAAPFIWVVSTSEDGTIAFLLFSFTSDSTVQPSSFASLSSFAPLSSTASMSTLTAAGLCIPTLHSMWMCDYTHASHFEPSVPTAPTTAPEASRRLDMPSLKEKKEVTSAVFVTVKRKNRAEEAGVCVCGCADGNLVVFQCGVELDLSSPTIPCPISHILTVKFCEDELNVAAGVTALQTLKVDDEHSLLAVGRANGAIELFSISADDYPIIMKHVLRPASNAHSLLPPSLLLETSQSSSVSTVSSHTLPTCSVTSLAFLDLHTECRCPDRECVHIEREKDIFIAAGSSDYSIRFYSLTGV
ncbi:putative Elongator complex protein 2 [Blattamonas nauphoetae]|uniref:Elongator complex protein 2 n=1 Tax=Blattamonas nauphoetae TaxID=2049346 RepID=A0ABQ9YG14_9EUKA|nr:putative Elongator complex protein 2 [Blattamonas nauphoetae]